MILDCICPGKSCISVINYGCLHSVKYPTLSVIFIKRHIIYYAWGHLASTMNCSVN